MSGLLSRASELFLAPAAPAAARPATAPASTVDVAAVVADPRDLAAAAGGVAAALRRSAGARTAVVCLPASPAAHGPATTATRDFTSPHEPFESARGAATRDFASPCDTPVSGSVSAEPAAPGRAATPLATVAAARLARRLTDRGIESVGRGALCHVTLPEEAELAVRLAWRVIGASVDAPVVIGVAGRNAERDAFLAQADRLFLAVREDSNPVYVEIALASLARLGPPAERVIAPTGPVARRAAARGFARLTPAGAETVPA